MYPPRWGSVCGRPQCALSRYVLFRNADRTECGMTSAEQYDSAPPDSPLRRDGDNRAWAFTKRFEAPNDDAARVLYYAWLEKGPSDAEE
jgi:hypothetical protein